MPGVGAFPEAMRRLERAGARRRAARARRRRRPAARDLPRHAAAVRASTEHEGARGLGLLPGEVTALRAPRLPHIGWNLVTLRAPGRADRGPRRRRRLLPRALASPAGPRTPADVVGRARVRRAFASIVERGTLSGVQFHPEKSSRDGLALLRNFTAAARGGRMILYPAIDILDGQAVRLVQGRFEDETVYHDDPLEAARSWVDAGARILHVVDLDGARAGEPRSLEHLRRIVAGTGVPVQYGGGLRTVDAVREALRAGAERAVVGTAAFRDVDFLDDDRRRASARASSSSVDVRGGQDRHRGLDRDHGAARDRGPRAAGRTAACAPSSTPTWTATACSTGPDLDERPPRGRGRPRALPLLRRHRRPRAPPRPRRPAPGQPRAA